MASLEIWFLSWSIISNWDILVLEWLWVVLCWNTALVNEVLCSLTLLLQTSTWSSNVRRTAVVISTGPLINHILVQLFGILSLGCINRVLSVLHPLKKYLDLRSVLKCSSGFLTQFLDVKDCDKWILGGFLVEGLVHLGPAVSFFRN